MCQSSASQVAFGRRFCRQIRAESRISGDAKMGSQLPETYFTTRFELEDFDPDPATNFAIVTAFNPQDEASPDDANTRADECLRSELVGAGFTPFRVTGGSPDWTHQEPGWGFVTTLEDALVIARRFNQRAIWWVESGQLFLVACSDPRPIDVAPFGERIRTR